MKISIDMEKYKALSEDMSRIENEIEMKNKELDSVKKEILKIFPRGYWWAYNIDPNWRRPKKYSIREVGNGYVIVKEVFKKAPWDGFDGKRVLHFDELLELDIFKTEEEAKSAVYNRTCPKCGGSMKYTTRAWCDKCLSERSNKAREFESNNTFYAPNENKIYHIGYTDELTREKGYGGKRFVFKCLDTGEIIESDNLWSQGVFGKDVSNLQAIEFIVK